MSDWSRFNDQFRETDWERQERWKATLAKRKAGGKCWQCAKLVAECTCPNVKHAPVDLSPVRQDVK